MALSLVGIAANQNVAVDTAIGSSHLSSVQSFYIAEAGLERGKLEAAQRLMLNDWASFTPLLNDSNAGPLSGGMAFGSEITFQGGTYRVAIANDPGDPGADDTNRAVTVTSTGKYGSSMSTVRTTMRMNTMPPLPGSVNLVGEAVVSIKGDAVAVDGHNHDLAGNRDSSVEARVGIAVCDIPAAMRAAKVANVIAGITLPQSVDGYGGTPSVAYREALADAEVRRIVDILKDGADYRDSYSFNASTDTPKISFFSDSDVILKHSNCANGAGVIVVDGHNLIVESGVGWTGLVIVKGGSVIFKGGSTEGVPSEPGRIMGGLIATTVHDLQGQSVGGNLFRLQYSKEALNMANRAITSRKGKWAVLSWQRVK